MNEMLDENMVPRRPRASADELSAPFFEGCERRVLMIQTCQLCGTRQLGSYRCWECTSKDLEWGPADGKGTIYSYTLVRNSPHPFFATQVPYIATVVELDEGPRIYAPFLGNISADIKIGSRCRITFVEEDQYFFPFCALDDD